MTFIQSHKTPRGWSEAEATWFKTSEGWLLINGTPQPDRPISGNPPSIRTLELNINWIYPTDGEACWYCMYDFRDDHPNCQGSVAVIDSSGGTLWEKVGGPFTIGDFNVVTLPDLPFDDLALFYTSGFADRPEYGRIHRDSTWVAKNLKGNVVCSGNFRSAPQPGAAAFQLLELGDGLDDAQGEYWLYDWELPMTKTKHSYALP